MIVRIVKMEFEKSKIPDFLANFNASVDTIRDFAGCSHVQLLRDESDACVFFTYSHWESEDHLNAYRDSAFFKSVWGTTREMFKAPPQAWSLKDHTNDCL